jgi:Leucine-rich repeat (LRR) protein
MLKKLFILSALIIIYINIETHLASQQFEIDLTDKFVIDDILLKKPFVKQCDQPVVEEKFDQMNKSCPLPYRSNTSTTGCFCNYATRTVECIYMNRLNDFPLLVNNYDNNDLSDIDTLLENNYDSLTWNIDLKCRNFSTFKSFQQFLNLNYIEILDLSSTGSARNNKCKYYDEKLNKVRSLTDSDKVNYLYQIGELYQEDDDIDIDKIEDSNQKIQNLTIKHLDLGSNRIKMPYLNRKRFSLKQNQIVSIDSLSLANNFIEKLIIENVDLCSFKISKLNLSSNKLYDLDISFLIILTQLDLNKNNLTTFLIDYLNNDLIEHSSNCNNINKIFKNNYNETVLISNLKYLDLSYNNLAALPFGYIENVRFIHLESFDATFNLIRLIKFNDFYQFNNLIYLYLYGNKIERIENDSFSTLISLKYLDMSMNHLVEIPDTLFKFTNRIEILKINSNYLKEIPRESLKYLTSVKYLYLNDNEFKKVSNFSFGYMLNLLELYLANNRIESIDTKAFFIDDRSFVGPGLLEKLDLSHNLLETLNSSIFSYLTNLRYLIISNNLIKRIDFNSFYGINYLITLDLTMNQLSKIDFLQNKNFSYMRYLKLAHNNLEYINGNSFYNLKSLKQLDLSSNKIRGLADCAFNGIQDTIKKITLNYNQIRLINSCAFMLGFRNMRLIQVLHNPLNCTNNCEFFYSIYNPPYSISYEGTECINGAVSGLNCNLMQYQRINHECRRRLQWQKCPNSKTYQEFEMREFLRRRMSNKKSNEATNWTDSYDFEIFKEQDLKQPAGHHDYETLPNHTVIFYFNYVLFCIILLFSTLLINIDYS